MNDQAIEQEIQANGLTAPRVTPSDITANIAKVEYLTHTTSSGQVLRWAILLTQSGFAVVGKPSVSVSPENDDAAIGMQVAYDNSRNELWPLMGYALKQQLHEVANEPPAPGAAHSNYSTMAPHQQRVVDEKTELGEKIHKLVGFFDSPIFASLSADEQSRLQQQVIAMDQYFTILLNRIAAFAPA